MEREYIFYWKDENGEVEVYRFGDAVEMRIDGGLQWNSLDEYRYHQSLFLLPALCVEGDIKALVLGGGDGLGVRELLRLKEIKSIKLVDISKAITDFAKTHPVMRELNYDSLNNPRVEVINADAFSYVKEAKERGEKYDLIVADYPDPYPREHQVNRLFSEKHYRDLYDLLSDKGILALQATTPYFSPNVFRKIQLNLLKAGFKTLSPLRINVRSFGDIGIVLAKKEEEPIELKKEVPEMTFFTDYSILNFVVFHRDELPNLSDEEIEKTPLHKLVKYDLEQRPIELEIKAREAYLKQIG